MFCLYVCASCRCVVGRTLCAHSLPALCNHALQRYGNIFIFVGNCLPDRGSGSPRFPGAALWHRVSSSNEMRRNLVRTNTQQRANTSRNTSSRFCVQQVRLYGIFYPVSIQLQQIMSSTCPFIVNL